MIAIAIPLSEFIYSNSLMVHLYWEHAFDANNSYVVGELTWIQSHLFLITFLPFKRFY